MTLLPPALVVVLAATCGLAAGSFVNVVAHRVPAGLSVVRPASACPACGHDVRGRDNVPVLSWLLLRGRCRDCAAPISGRYPAVEAGTGLLFVVLALRLVDRPALLVAAVLLAAAGVALALIDLDHGRLPFAITGVAGTLVAAALCSGWAWTLRQDGPGALLDAVVPVAVGTTLWLGVFAGLRTVTRGRGMGLGDVALAPVLGAVLGASGVGAAVVGLGLAFALGAVVGAVVLLGRGGGRGSRIPFGPFMLLGTLGGVLAGAPLAAAYLSLVGLR